MSQNDTVNPLHDLINEHLRGRVREEDLEDLAYETYELARVFAMRTASTIEANFETFADFAVEAYQRGRSQ